MNLPHRLAIGTSVRHLVSGLCTWGTDRYRDCGTGEVQPMHEPLCNLNQQ